MKKKRHIYRLAAGIMLSALIITGLPAGQAQAADGKMTVKLTKGKGKAYTKKLKKGVKLKLTAKLGKKKLSRKYLSFKTSKKSVASVSKTGVIKAKKAGTAWITVTYKKKQTKRKARIKVKITSPVQKKETGIGNYKPYTVNGKKTIKTYLLNGLVPCGRTLYIYGGGWGSYGTQIATPRNLTTTASTNFKGIKALTVPDSQDGPFTILSTRKATAKSCLSVDLTLQKPMPTMDGQC